MRKRICISNSSSAHTFTGKGTWGLRLLKVYEVEIRLLSPQLLKTCFLWYVRSGTARPSQIQCHLASCLKFHYLFIHSLPSQVYAFFFLFLYSRFLGVSGGSRVKECFSPVDFSASNYLVNFQIVSSALVFHFFLVFFGILF